MAKKKTLPLKKRKGQPPDLLRKSGAHKDKKRETGREPIKPENLSDQE